VLLALDHRSRVGARDAAAAGLVVIPYHFLRPGMAKEQARQFRDIAELDAGMATALDWEGRASQTASPADAEAVGAELEALTGRAPLGYWGIPGSTPAAPTARMRLWPRWVPRYPVVGVNSFTALPAKVREHPGLYWPDGRGLNGLPYFGQYSAWGRVAGITGLVDRSVAFFPSIEDAIAWCAGKAPQIAAGSPRGADQMELERPTG
jgi:Glycosyl hydrolases family 25